MTAIVLMTHVWTHRAAGIQGLTKEVRIDVLGGPVIIVLAILAFLAWYIIPRIG